MQQDSTITTSNKSTNSSARLSESDTELQDKKIDNPLNRTLFVFKEFNGDLFSQVHFHTKSILGLTALKYILNQKTVSLRCSNQNKTFLFCFIILPFKKFI